MNTFMKVSTLGAALAAVLAVPAVSFASEDDGIYVRGSGGLSFLSAKDANYKTGFNGSLSVGHKQGSFRYEVEGIILGASQKDNGIDDSAIVAMANVYYDFDINVDNITPFLGAGIGYASITEKTPDTDGTTDFGNSKVTEGAFAYQAIAGVSYSITENVSADLSYRYLGARAFGQNVAAQSANIGIAYRF